MDIFDKLSKKLSYRRFSNREKILFSILIVLIFQIAVFYFFIRPKENILQEKMSQYENSKVNETEKINYKGMSDFSDENITLLSSEMNLTADNISREQNSNVETLRINGESDVDDISKILNFSKYFGYSEINLNRNGENKFSYSLKAEKPSENIYYSDLKKSYFKDKEEPESIKPVGNVENNKKSSENVEIKNTKKTEIKNIKKINKEKSKPRKVAKNISKKENINLKSKENPVQIIYVDKNNKKLKEEAKTNLEKEIIKDIKENKLNSEYDEFNLFSNDEDIKIDNFNDILSVIEIKNPDDEKIRICTDKISRGISFKILFMGELNEFGFLKTNGDLVNYNGDINLNNWNEISIENEEVSGFYVVPKNNEDLLIYVREVKYHEEI